MYIFISHQKRQMEYKIKKQKKHTTKEYTNTRKIKNKWISNHKKQNLLPQNNCPRMRKNIRVISGDLGYYRFIRVDNPIPTCHNTVICPWWKP